VCRLGCLQRRARLVQGRLRGLQLGVGRLQPRVLLAAEAADLLLQLLSGIADQLESQLWHWQQILRLLLHLSAHDAAAESQAWLPIPA